MVHTFLCIFIFHLFGFWFVYIGRRHYSSRGHSDELMTIENYIVSDDDIISRDTANEQHHFNHSNTLESLTYDHFENTKICFI